ncbi:MAG: DUF2797 domain-containing protein [Bacteroidia bacterium]|nr:DUF2797 domain-containing protein [Bacteroidia bacterium]
MKYSGNLSKMRVKLDSPVSYELHLGEEAVPMNELIGKELKFSYEGRINCIICGDKTKKSFAQGFCYRHFMNAPEASPCIIRPEVCEGHLGKGRDVEWEQAHHVQPHIVYLALTNGMKVGVTREQQVPTRWIDQGAWKAVKFAETPNRYLAGVIEVAMKDHLSDKTNWQRMLKNQMNMDLDILEEKTRLLDLLPAEYAEYQSSNDEVTEIHYPVEAYPEKVKSLSFEKMPEIEGTLLGIRGQYLIFDAGRVLNVRKHTGYWIDLEV